MEERYYPNKMAIKKTWVLNICVYVSKLVFEVLYTFNVCVCVCVSARHKGDLLNRMGNIISKTVGEKKKVRSGVCGWSDLASAVFRNAVPVVLSYARNA